MADVDLTCNENFDEFFSYPGTLNPTIEARLESLSKLRSQEAREVIQFSNQYLHNPVLDPPIREHMVDCLITFSKKLDLKVEAVFLAVNVLDRYLDATKTYNPNNMSLTVQNIAWCLRPKYIARCNEVQQPSSLYMVKKDKYAVFILLITLFEHNFLRVPPSLVAAVAVQILNPKPDSRTVTYVVSSAYPLDKVRECYRLLFSVLMDSSKALKIKAMHPILSDDLGLPLTE